MDAVRAWIEANRENPALVYAAEIEGRKARYDQITLPMHPRLSERLAQVGIEKLYRHQAMAYDAAVAGQDLVVVTGTASGKTLCYNLPVLQSIVSEPKARALYLFPTKALAQDQLGKLEQFAPGPDVRMGTYDGDTPRARRASLRKLAHVLLTNPDMLHVGILPGHEQWVDYFKNLRYIVIDEMHTYRGMFGSHVAGVLRRLLRLCEWHRNRPQIIACSATIGNPTQLFEKLTGRRATLIDEDGAPRPRKTYAFWNPTETGSPNLDTAKLMGSLTNAGLRTLAFCRARITTELVLKTAREHSEHPERIESYRAGYTAKERRQIEQALFKGKLLALAATNAMELGVDIGGLDAVVMNGYAGTVSSFLQQAGRAGRGSDPGLAIMVAHEDPLEQFLIREPHRVLEGATESVSINPENPQVLAKQLLCAAYERPISPSEVERFGKSALDAAENLDRTGELAFRSGHFYFPEHHGPASGVNIRGAGGEQVLLYNEGEELGSMERWRAMQYAHEGAVYLHRGQSYLVDRLDLEAGRAELHAETTNYYTQPLVQSSVEPLVEIERNGRTSLISVKVTDLVVGYRVRAMDGGTVLAIHELDFPPDSFETIAVRYELPEFRPDEDPEKEMAAVHGLEHALLAVAPVLAGCDRGDLGSSWYAYAPEIGLPAVYTFDRAPGGVGLSESLFRHQDAWLSMAFQLLSSCGCDDGCPACLLSPRCESANQLLSKPSTLALIKTLRIR